jgi:hypothetical protein
VRHNLSDRPLAGGWSEIDLLASGPRQYGGEQLGAATKAFQVFW